MVGASTIARDASERRRSEELRSLLVDELNHRVKNTLATVQSIAAQSLKGISDVDGRETFDARLVSLSRTHDLLARDSWESASLRDLLHQEIEPYQLEDGTRFVLTGPDFGLRPKAALALGLALHELATNAAKYGALSTPPGRVHVTWEIPKPSESGALRLKWVESGGPPVQNTGHKGFGSVLIERGLALELDAKVELDFNPKGLACTIEMPLGREEAIDG
jgi:two-component sensor histidine kinase